jgi:hypothetical protein
MGPISKRSHVQATVSDTFDEVTQPGGYANRQIRGWLTYAAACVLIGAHRSGRTILVMRPGKENTKKHDGQIKYLVREFTRHLSPEGAPEGAAARAHHIKLPVVPSS